MQQINDNERVRDHLANERTYLAWLRTGMAMMGFGAVIAKLRYLFLMAPSVSSEPGIVHASAIGVPLAISGLVTVAISLWRYAVVQDQIRQNNYHASKRIAIMLSTVLIVLGVLIVWYLLQDMAPAARI